jgi:hypothetical protein
MKNSPKTAHQVRSSDDADPQKVVEQIETTLTDLGVWISSAQTIERTQRAEWDGQSDDGRKWMKNQPRGTAIFPWEGAADTRQRLADMSIDELVMLKTTSFFTGSLRATAMEANDTDAAGRVQTLLQYEIQQRLRAELWEELNYATAWSETYGHAVLGTFWKQSWTTGLETFTVEDLAVMVQEMLAQQAAAEGEMQGEEVPGDAFIEDAYQVVESYLMDNDEDNLSSLIQQRYPTLPEKRVRKLIARLRKEGKDTFRLPVQRPGRPTVQAFMPGFDIFYPWMVDNIIRAPWVAVQELYWEPDLRAMEMQEGWDKEFIDRLIEIGPGSVIDQSALEAKRPDFAQSISQALTRSAASRFQSERERSQQQYAVLRVYLRATDEDGVPALHEVVMHPSLSRAQDGKPGLVGQNRLLDYYHEGGCFVSLRREYKIRPIWESRGVAELAMTAQMEMKARRDSHIDRTSLGTMPPVRVGLRTMGPGGGERLEGIGIKPGGLVPSFPGQAPTDFMNLPAYQFQADGIESMIAADNANLLGLSNKLVPQDKLIMHRQWLVTGFLIQMRELVLKILSLDQQFMDPIQVSRVIGSTELPYTVTREEISGQYDVQLSFDVRSMDMEWLKQKLSVLKEAVAFDRSGAFKDVPVMKYLVASVDPNLADLAIADVESAREMEAEDEKKAIGTLLSGVEIKPPMGSNAQVRLETAQQEIAQNPVVNQRFQNDPWFRRMMERRMAKWQFDLQQRENAQIGREGWMPAMDDLEAPAESA